MGKDYYYNPKTQTLVGLLDENIVEFKNKDEDCHDIECYVALHDLAEDRVYIQEMDEFHESFLVFTLDEMPMLQLWYEMDDIALARLKRIVAELLETEV
ncbi:hypothetical protein QL992_17960 [Microbacterium sp. APC 3898]|uniref:Uncharacterized protein n=1 Tax=Planococcus notacanthi TaxID=3035188 RepID=A0ABT7ZPY4_9BACL|nr:MULTISPECIES: hypothetical protein [Terrabacteria group]MDN3429205.1 hypothetical protein [Planococcus sp. APC 4016]MDN3440002.1 hypothetical protein [Planococcus sp. APC 3900]MDN3501110.1 hypothetical protein [Microbacterium sp. APC 3898]